MVTRDFPTFHAQAAMSNVQEANIVIQFQDQKTVLAAIANSIENTVARSLQRSKDGGGVMPIVEVNHSKLSEEFSEVDRIARNDSLSREDKLSFLARPGFEDITRFLTTLFKFGCVNIEVQVQAFMLLKKFLQKTDWKLRTANWRIIFIISLQIIQKFQGIPFFKAEDLHFLYPLFRASDYNDLEIKFLHLINWECTIDLNQYILEYEQLIH